MRYFFNASGLATSTRPRNRCSVLTYSSLSFAGLLLGAGEHLVDRLGDVDLGHVHAAGHPGQAVELAFGRELQGAHGQAELLDQRRHDAALLRRATPRADARCPPRCVERRRAWFCASATAWRDMTVSLLESMGLCRACRAPNRSRGRPPAPVCQPAGHVGCRRDAPALVRPATAPAMEAPSLSPNLPHNRLRRAAAMKSPRATRLSRKVITSPMHTLFLSIAPTVG